jgi:TolB-like protein/tetratricopeptide (TPR) repeat protein
MPALARGTKLGIYEILSPLGAGGMGEVYRATDTKLGRDIALKVLPADMALDAERLARFRREAKTLAQLDHPGIVTIHSVEECDGIHFLTMQLVDGLPLDRAIPPGGLPVDQIVGVAEALADALAAAHDKGIIHRDLKPANVMINADGRVKVLDFGLAKELSSQPSNDATRTSANQTQAGMVMGTPAYMSPEQIAARPLDHRTDIFSLGVLLYEMATGKRPFEAQSSMELMSAILRDSPPPVTELRAELPADLARVIRRCMEKDPRHRMQTARDVSNEFRELARAGLRSTPVAASSAMRAVPAADSGGTRPSSGGARSDEGFWIAVLPFKHAGSSADLAALADGLTGDICTGFSRFSFLHVIARGSAARAAAQSSDVRATGQELGARYVMEGNLRQSSKRLRVAVQIVDTLSGAHIWAENYDREFDPAAVFDLQDELASMIVGTAVGVQGVLLSSITESLRSQRPEDLTPHQAFLRSLAYLQNVCAEEHAISREALEHAVAAQPNYADAWTMLSIMYREEFNHGFSGLPDPLGRALTAGRRAVALAPASPIAHLALATVAFYMKDMATFRSEARRSIELNPLGEYCHAYLGMIMAYSGDWELGCAWSQRARTINTRHPAWYWFTPAMDAYRRGDYTVALECALKAQTPGIMRSHVVLAAVQARLGNMAAAQKAVQALLAVKPDFAEVARQECEKWLQPEMVEDLLEALQQAGLGIAAP